VGSEMCIRDSMKLIFKPINLITTNYRLADNIVAYIGYPNMRTHIGFGYYRMITKRVG